MIRRFIPLLSLLAGCTANVPAVHGHDIVVPDRSPSRAVQALSAPSTSNTEGGSGSSSQAFCLHGQQTLSQFNADGTFITEFTCEPGGGIALLRNEGVQDANGDGSYDMTSVLESGGELVWHFTFDTSDDFASTAYEGHDDAGHTYSSVYVYVDATHSQVHEVWNLAEGSYVTDGLYGNDGSFDGTESFDDPSTDASPDWSLDEVYGADGTLSQTVHFQGDGFVSDYTYDVAADGSSSYSFATDLADTQASPDFTGSYSYNADFSGSGAYRELFDDGSTLDVNDVINANGSFDERWSFDDVSTDQPVDQEGVMVWSVDGSGEGRVTTHVVGGGDQTCDIHISADGNQTIDHCG